MSEEWLYTPDPKAVKKHTDKGAPRAEEILVYPVQDKDGKTIPGKMMFDDDEDGILDKDEKVGLPTIWYKVKVVRP